jgi:tetratricopeptide (TPR) repeat protein
MRSAFTIIGLLTLCGCQHVGRTPLESTVLTDDWQAVIRLTNHHGLSTPQRLLRAHALIATNKSDDAACIFGAVASTEELQAWAAWTEDLVDKYPVNGNARYLHADALFRTGDDQRAIEEFDRALKAKGRHALTLNARAVMHALRGEPDAAKSDLSRALTINPHFSDALMNRGFLAIQTKESPEGAIDDFNAAMPSGLAMAGNGYVQIALGNLEEGRQLLENAAPKSCTGRFISQGANDLLTWLDGYFHDQRLDEHPGTTVSRTSTDVNFSNAQQMIMTGDQQALKRGVNLMASILGDTGPNSVYAQRAGSLYTGLAKADPGRAQQMADQIYAGKSWNSGVEKLVQSLGSITATYEAPQTKISAKAGPISLSRDSGEFKLTAPLERSLQPIQDLTQTNGRGFDTLDRALRGVGGVTTSLAAAHVDNGDWGPLRPVYALYPLANPGGAK